VAVELRSRLFVTHVRKLFNQAEYEKRHNDITELKQEIQEIKMVLGSIYNLLELHLKSKNNQISITDQER
jgi:hypothetical protein